MDTLYEVGKGDEYHFLDYQITIDAAYGEIVFAIAPHAGYVPEGQIPHTHVEPTLVFIVHGHLIILPLISVVIGGGFTFQSAGILGVPILHTVIHIGQRPRIERVLIQIGIRDDAMTCLEGVHLRHDRLQQMPHFLLPHVFTFVRYKFASFFEPQIKRCFPRADAEHCRNVAAADGDGDRAIGPVRPCRKPGSSVHACGVAQYLRRRHQ